VTLRGGAYHWRVDGGGNRGSISALVSLAASLR